MSDSLNEEAELREIDSLLRDGLEPAEIAGKLGIPQRRVSARQELNFEVARELVGSGMSDEAILKRVAVSSASITGLRAWHTQRASGPIEEQFNKIAKRDLLHAIEDIDRDGIPKNAVSHTYDIVYEGRRYPPKLVVAIAFKHAIGTAIKTSEFNGGRDTRAFKLLEKEGFRIEEKGRAGLKDLLFKFVRNVLLINQSSAEGSLRTSEFIDQSYGGLKINVSFGKGTYAEVPFMAFLGYGQTVQHGINPVILFSRTRSENNLEICFGVSSANVPDVLWDDDIVADLPRSQSGRYEESFVKRAFTITSSDELESRVNEIITALDETIEEYHEQFREGGDFHEVCRSFDLQWVSYYLKRLREIVAELGLERDSQRVVFSTRQKGLQFIVGGRYCFVLTKRGGPPHFGLASTRILNDVTEPFKGRPPSYYSRFYSIDEVDSFANEPLEMARDTLKSRDTKSGFRRFDDLDFRNTIFGGSISSEAKDEAMSNEFELKSLNTIFYGPPGTGKTKTATDLIKRFEEAYRAKESVSVELFLQSLPWWQVFTLVIDDLGGKNVEVSQIYGHEFVKPKLRASKNKTLTGTIWGSLMNHTSPDSKTVFLNKDQRYPPFVFEKNEDSTWNLTSDWASQLDDVLEEFKRAKDNPTDNVRNTKFVTFHQSYSYEDFIEGIKPSASQAGELAYRIKAGSFKSFCEQARIDKENKYLFVIDEINRGNISKIFGELITSIEDSKRESRLNCIPIELQYSKEDFTVPDNVYLVGTMNTSDRSIATLDLALRRRFAFRPLYPQASEVKDVGAARVNAVFVKLNKRIRALLGDDYQIGHTFFLGLGNSVPRLKEAWFNRVLPLLHEYFYGDFNKLGALVSTFVEYEKVDIDLEDEKETVISRLKTEDDYRNDDKFIADFNALV